MKRSIDSDTPRPDVTRQQLVRIRDEWRRRGIEAAASACQRGIDGAVPAVAGQQELFA